MLKISNVDNMYHWIGAFYLLCLPAYYLIDSEIVSCVRVCVCVLTFWLRRFVIRLLCMHRNITTSVFSFSLLLLKFNRLCTPILTFVFLWKQKSPWCIKRTKSKLIKANIWRLQLKLFSHRLFRLQNCISLQTMHTQQQI